MIPNHLPPPLYSNPHPNVSVERPTLPPNGGRYVSGLSAKSPPRKVPYGGVGESGAVKFTFVMAVCKQGMCARTMMVRVADIPDIGV